MAEVKDGDIVFEYPDDDEISGNKLPDEKEVFILMQGVPPMNFTWGRPVFDTSATGAETCRMGLGVGGGYHTHLGYLVAYPAGMSTASSSRIVTVARVWRCGRRAPPVRPCGSSGPDRRGARFRRARFRRSCRSSGRGHRAEYRRDPRFRAFRARYGQ